MGVMSLRAICRTCCSKAAAETPPPDGRLPDHIELTLPSPMPQRAKPQRFVRRGNRKRCCFPSSLPMPNWWHAAWSDDQCYRSEEHTSELQSLMRISYAVFCLKKKTSVQSINIKQIHANISTPSHY